MMPLTLTPKQACTVAGVILLVIVLLAGAVWIKHQDAAAKDLELHKAKVINEAQAANTQDLKNIMQNQFAINQQNADMTAQAIKAARSGQVQPVTHFTVTAPTVAAAAEDVSKRIDAKDPTLPPAAIASSDRTAVIPNSQEQKVDVFKINNYRNWEVSTGVGVHRADWYVPVEIRRNYDKIHSVSAEVHVGRDDGRVGVTGGELKYTIRTDKLFGIF